MRASKRLQRCHSAPPPQEVGPRASQIYFSCWFRVLIPSDGIAVGWGNYWSHGFHRLECSAKWRFCELPSKVCLGCNLCMRARHTRHRSTSEQSASGQRQRAMSKGNHGRPNKLSHGHKQCHSRSKCVEGVKEKVFTLGHHVPQHLTPIPLCKNQSTPRWCAIAMLQAMASFQNKKANLVTGTKEERNHCTQQWLTGAPPSGWKGPQLTFLV